MDTTPEIPMRELDQRRNDGIDVRLLWNPRTGGTCIAVEDARSGESFVFPVAPFDALDAFRHPYAYAGQRPTRSRVPIS
jgi:hypothetical protein